MKEEFRLHPLSLVLFDVFVSFDTTTAAAAAVLGVPSVFCFWYLLSLNTTNTRTYAPHIRAIPHSPVLYFEDQIITSKPRVKWASLFSIFPSNACCLFPISLNIMFNRLLRRNFAVKTLSFLPSLPPSLYFLLCLSPTSLILRT